MTEPKGKARLKIYCVIESCPYVTDGSDIVDQWYFLTEKSAQEFAKQSLEEDRKCKYSTGYDYQVLEVEVYE